MENGRSSLYAPRIFCTLEACKRPAMKKNRIQSVQERFEHCIKMFLNVQHGVFDIRLQVVFPGFSWSAGSRFAKDTRSENGHLYLSRSAHIDLLEGRVQCAAEMNEVNAELCDKQNEPYGRYTPSPKAKTAGMSFGSRAISVANFATDRVDLVIW